MNINDLPDELLVDIFLFLRDPLIWYKIISPTCQRWKFIITKLLCHRIVALRYNYFEEIIEISTNFQNQIEHNGQSIMKCHFKTCSINDSQIVYRFIQDIGPHIKSFDLFSSRSLSANNDCSLKSENFIRTVFSFCTNLKILILRGQLVDVAKCLFDKRPELKNLEKLIVEDKSFHIPNAEHCKIDDKEICNGEEVNIGTTIEQDEDVSPKTTACFVEWVIREASENLVYIEIRMPYISGPRETCFHHLPRFLHLRTFVLVLNKPSSNSPAYHPSFIETLLDCVCQLKQLRNLCIACSVKLTDPYTLDLQHHFQCMATSMPDLTYLDIGFQAMLATTYCYTDDGFEFWFEPVNEAPWSQSLLSGLACDTLRTTPSCSVFPSLTDLTLSNIDFSCPMAAQYLRRIIKRLKILSLEGNYNLDDKILHEAFGGDRNAVCAEHLQVLSICRACLSYENLSRIIIKCCPNLKKLHVAYVDGLSFKDLVLNLHSSLHDAKNCGQDFGLAASLALEDQTVPIAQDGKPSLIIELGTGIGLCHAGANELRSLSLCGLTEVIDSRYYCLKIDRICA